MWKEVKDFFSMQGQFATQEKTVTAATVPEGLTGTVVDGRVPVIRDVPSVSGNSIGRTWSANTFEIEQIIPGPINYAKVVAYVPIDSPKKQYMKLNEPVDPPPPSERGLYVVLHDKALTDRGIQDLSNRMDNRDPEVYLLQDESGRKEGIVKDVFLGELKQRMCFDLFRYGAPNQELATAKRKFRVIYDWMRAFANGSGFDDLTDRTDFINGWDLGSGNLPALDKARVCGGATLRGVPVGDRLKVETISMSGALSLDYLIANRHLFFTAMNSGPNPTDWSQGGGEPVYIPLITPKDIDCYYPLNRLKRVTEIANPYYVY